MSIRKIAPALMLGPAVLIAAAALVSPVAVRGVTGAAATSIDYDNATGTAETVTVLSGFDTTGAFFSTIGTNGRTCGTCHPLNQGSTITPAYVQQVFDNSNGLDPLFDPVDGTNSPRADRSTLDARRAASSMLFTKALIRIGLRMPSNAQFRPTAIDDPYHYASATLFSLFRRPLPVTNLKFLSTVMWDGRESAPGRTVAEALADQAINATLTHLQAAAAPPTAQLNDILNFETNLFTSQVTDNNVGSIAGAPIDAGPTTLVNADYYAGINEIPGLGVQDMFNPQVFDFYTSWLGAPPPGGGPPAGSSTASAQQQSVARGEMIFNTRPFAITNVAGLNDVLARPTINGTCTTCHSTPVVGSNGLPLLMNTGVAAGNLRTPDMPLYTLKNTETGAIVQTTDPGAAMTTGRWNDIGKFKVPALRGLSNQAPFFHNGFAATTADVVTFYNNRFNMQLNSQQQEDLANFLQTL